MTGTAASTAWPHGGLATPPNHADSRGGLSFARKLRCSTEVLTGLEKKPASDLFLDYHAAASFTWVIICDIACANKCWWFTSRLLLMSVSS